MITLIFLSLIGFGQPANVNLDPSWTAALGYAFTHHWQAGVDYIFTFAPLGYHQHFHSAYLPELFKSFLIFQIVISLSLSILFLYALRFIKSDLDKILYFVLLITVSLGWHLEPKYFLALHIIFIFSIHLLTRYDFTWINYFGLLLAFLALIIIGMGKFTFFVWTGIAVTGIIFMAWWQHSWKIALVILLSFIFLFSLVWLILGQSLANIPIFIINSIEITKGYSEAMSLGYLPTQLFYALAIFLCFLGLVVLNIATQSNKMAALVTGTVLLLSLFLAFKAGFVRQGLHVLIFFPTALTLVFLMNDYSNVSKIVYLIQRVLRYAVVVFSLYGVLISGGFGIPHHAENFLGLWNRRVITNINTLADLPKLTQHYQSSWNNLKSQYELPEMRKIIANSTVDIFSWDQMIIFLNNFNWHPRPVFQSYTVYTKKLMDINQQFFLNNPPEFIIFKLQTIDHQFPLLNDAESYKILLQNYKPVIEEKGYLLLQYIAKQQSTFSSPILLEQDIKEGEWLNVEQWTDQPFLLTLDIDKSLLGKIYTTFYRLPEVYLETKTSEEKILRHRLIPRMAETGFLYNPLILSQQDINQWYTGETLTSVNELRLIIQPAWIQRLFSPKLGVKLTAFERGQKLMTKTN
ncbi:hypothetical protein [Thioflexithrix psekupsensis]|uniref:hypothetical protein n=1 Tax=Thioflexithrix psekupsensis TaxID=1570016 RepID=UPI00111DD78A|nr:hypothetical protein [Thioflexithrix psekupsensis]